MEDYLVKASLMGENPELYKLNKSLVDTDLMSDHEFWRIRQEQLQFQKSRLETRKDYKFAIPWSYAVTNNLKDQIFEQLPQVKKLFDNRKVSEEEFWNEFFRSHTYGDESELSKLFDKRGAIASRFDSKSAKSVEPVSDAQYVISRLVNLAANEADHHFEGFGTKEREYFQDEVKLRTHLLQEISESSARLLPSQTSVKLPSMRAGIGDDVRRSIILQDLTEDIHFEGQEIEPVVEREMKPVGSGPVSEPFVIHSNYKLPSTPSAHLVGLSPILSSMLKIEESEGAAEKEPELVSIRFSEIQDIHRRFMEILRHFWNVIPPLTVEKRQIAAQMVNILDRLEQDYNNWKVRINIADQLVCDELFKVMFQGVNRAREIYRDLSKIPSSSSK